MKKLKRLGYLYSIFYAVLSRFAARLGQDEAGQGTVEYVFILSVVVVGTSALARALLTALDTGILTLGGQLEQDLKTGRVSVGVWKN